jgi:hypothetical protein
LLLHHSVASAISRCFCNFPLLLQFPVASAALRCFCFWFLLLCVFSHFFAASCLARRPVKLDHETAAEFEQISAAGSTSAATRPAREVKLEDGMKESCDGSDSDEFAEFKCAAYCATDCTVS